MNKQVIDRLNQNNLRNTGCRRRVLNLFLDRTYALSHNDLENELGEDFDRVTIYRTLHTFLEKGIIHKVPEGENNITKYALGDPQCRQSNLEHVHFKCMDCGKIECLDEVAIPQVNLPKGYFLFETKMLLEGKCDTCNN